MDMGSTPFTPVFMSRWLNWYSTGLENRHPLWRYPGSTPGRDVSCMYGLMAMIPAFQAGDAGSIPVTCFAIILHDIGLSPSGLGHRTLTQGFIGSNPISPVLAPWSRGYDTGLSSQ